MGEAQKCFQCDVAWGASWLTVFESAGSGNSEMDLLRGFGNLGRVWT